MQIGSKSQLIFLLDKQMTEFKSFFLAHSYSQIAVLVDENTHSHCYDLVKSYIPTHSLIVIKSGEEQKNIQTCMHIWQHLTDLKFDRKGLLVNLGGGVIGDMGGFCAATYKRGIDFVQIPTTLLSQVDASVGGKLGIDFENFKNHIGVFQIPKAVFISTLFLQTLPYNQLISGYAEVIKHCLIKDQQKWKAILDISLDEIKSGRVDFDELVEHSILIKSQVVDLDPTEKGLRKVLNFGHTLGHAIETYFLDTPKKLLHGEAIAIGMIAESYLSYARGSISKEELEVISTHVLSIYGKQVILDNELELLLPFTLQDKKNSFGEVNFSLLSSVGACGYDLKVDEKLMREAIGYYQKLG